MKEEGEKKGGMHNRPPRMKERERKSQDEERDSLERVVEEGKARKKRKEKEEMTKNSGQTSNERGFIHH